MEADTLQYVQVVSVDYERWAKGMREEAVESIGAGLSS
jgi:hypothetical protein